jgi:hypothetical protein
MKNINKKKYTVKKRNKYGGGVSDGVVGQNEKPTFGLTPEAERLQKAFASTSDPNKKSWLKLMFEKYLSMGTQAFTNVTESGTNNLAKFMGVDPNKPLSDSLDVVNNDVEKNTRQILNAFNSPKAKKSLDNIKLLTEKFVETSRPAINKSAKILKDVIEKESVALSNAGLNMLGVVPVVGEVIEGARVIGNVMDVGNKAINASSEVISAVSDVAPELSKDAVAIGNNVSELSKVGSEMDSSSPKPNPNPNVEKIAKTGGGRGFKMVKKYQTGGRKTLKRINNSINEFLNSSIKNKHKLTKSNKK